MHWFFVQASQAARAELWIPSVVALLTGVENSVRVTMRQLDGHDLRDDEDLGPTLSHSLLRRAEERCLPVATLAFPDEKDFLERLRAKTPLVEVVRVRHDLCHGNVLSFANAELGDGSRFFTPECMRPLAHLLLDLSVRWTDALGAFRRAKGL